MSDAFHPGNKIVQQCLQGLAMVANGDTSGARVLFRQALAAASSDFERFLVTYECALLEEDSNEYVAGLENALAYAKQSNEISAQSAFATIYLKLAEKYDEVDERDKAEQMRKLSCEWTGKIFDQGPFYHGTRAELSTGDLLVAGHQSNYEDNLMMNHIYFTSNLKGAQLAASLAKGDGIERVYEVEPMGDFEDDPNVTDKKFPGNLTSSYRSTAPLRIIGERNEDYDDELAQWRTKLMKNKGEIIN